MGWRLRGGRGEEHGLGVEPETAWAPGLCVHVCTRVSTCARACVQATLPVPGTRSQFSSPAEWNAQPSPTQRAVSPPGWKAVLPGTGVATGLDQSGAHEETTHPSLRENAHENLPWVSWRPILSAGNSFSH